MGVSATLQYNTATGRFPGVVWPNTFQATGGVIIANTGTITLDSAKVLNTSVPLTINNGATLAMSTYLLTLNGDLVNNGGSTSGSSTGGVTITGTATQSIGSFTTSGTLTLNKSPGTATLTGDVSTNNLTLTAGTLTLGAYNLTVAGSITGGSATTYIVTNSTDAGTLIQNFGSGSSKTFPIGSSTTATDYCPASFTNSGTAQNFAVRVLTYTNGSNACVNKQWYVRAQNSTTANFTSIIFYWNSVNKINSFTFKDKQSC